MNASRHNSRSPRVSWGGLPEVLTAVREHPILGDYLVSLARQLRERSVSALERAKITGNATVAENCDTMVARCDQFIAELEQARPASHAVPEQVDPADEDRILEALPQYPPVRHLMSNLLSSVEMLASTSLMITAKNEPRLRGALRTVVDTSRELHTKLGLRY